MELGETLGETSGHGAVRRGLPRRRARREHRTHDEPARRARAPRSRRPHERPRARAGPRRSAAAPRCRAGTRSCSAAARTTEPCGWSGSTSTPSSPEPSGPSPRSTCCRAACATTGRGWSSTATAGWSRRARCTRCSTSSPTPRSPTRRSRARAAAAGARPPRPAPRRARRRARARPALLARPARGPRRTPTPTRGSARPSAATTYAWSGATTRPGARCSPATPQPGDHAAFPDSFPVTVASLASLRQLNDWIVERALELGEEPPRPAADRAVPRQPRRRRRRALRRGPLAGRSPSGACGSGSPSRSAAA